MCLRRYPMNPSRTRYEPVIDSILAENLHRLRTEKLFHCTPLGRDICRKK